MMMPILDPLFWYFLPLHMFNGWHGR